MCSINWGSWQSSAELENTRGGRVSLFLPTKLGKSEFFIHFFGPEFKRLESLSHFLSTLMAQIWWDVSNYSH